MGISLALVSMLCFAANILFTRYAIARMPVEAGFLLVLSVNIVFPVLLFSAELGVRGAPFFWNWSAAGLFTLGGVIGTFLGRRLLFDTVRLLGPSRASVVHSTAPAFALVFAWLLAGERLGAYEIVLMGVVWVGLWFTQPHAAAGAPQAAVIRKGLLVGALTVAGFGLGSVLRGLAMRRWDEAIMGTVLASSAALICQLAATRDWKRVRVQLRGASPAAFWLYVACGVSTSLGAIFMALAMNRMEIALAVLVVHTTPLFIFPVSVFILKHREDLAPRSVIGALLVLCGIALLAIR